MSLSTLMRHHVQWERPLITVDAARGAQRQTWNVVQDSMRCLVQPATAKEKMLFGQHAMSFTHRIYFDSVLDVQVGDRFRLTSAPGPVTSLGAVVNKYYLVTGFMDMGGQGGRCFRVDVIERAQ